MYRKPPQKSNPRPDEFEMSMVGQRSRVTLRHPEDMDLFVEIGHGRLTIAQAKKRVALRRQFEREMMEIAEREQRNTEFKGAIDAAIVVVVGNH